MLRFVRPKLLKLNNEEVIVKIKLKRRTKNHLNSMYIAPLVVGADIAAGIHVFYFAEKLNKKVSFAFKGIGADFVKRAESDVTFVCSEGQKILSLIKESEESEKRINDSISVQALNDKLEIIAHFTMIVSVKLK